MKPRTYIQDEPPENARDGDIWIKPGDSSWSPPDFDWLFILQWVVWAAFIFTLGLNLGSP